MNLASIEHAAGCIRRYAVETPLLRSAALDAAIGGRALLKVESLQVAGSFKFRAAIFRLSCLTAAERRAGVVAYSSGNFGRALAAAGQLLDVRVRVVVPEDAPEAKVQGIRALGGEIVVSRHGDESREAVAARRAEQLAKDSGAVHLHPFEDELLITAHAALALELLSQARRVVDAVDDTIVPCGGGGLAAGCCLAVTELGERTRVHAVEPETCDGMRRSVQAQRVEDAGGTRGSICDALLAPRPGGIAFRIAGSSLAGVVVVTDDEVRRALRFAVDVLNLALEPSGAAPLAALLAGKLDVRGKCVAAILTGGNVGASRLATLLGEEDA
jgi:threonine dehydratase